MPIPLEESDPELSKLFIEHINSSNNTVIDLSRPSRARPITSIHIGRNDKCYCGSGKKYKKCCGSL